MTTHSHNTLNKRAVIFSIGVSLFLVLIKAFAWFETDSLSLLSSLLDSSLDVVVSSLNLLAVLYAAKPEDEDHRFGHNSIEDIAGLVQATFIAASGIFLIYEAVHRFLQPQPILAATTGIIILSISMLCTLSIVLYQRYVRLKTKSVVVEADSLHYTSDFLVNGAVIIAMFVAANPAWSFVDPALAILVALYILYSASQIGLKSYNNLMDREMADDERNQIIALLEQNTEILGYHALKTRRSGSRAFVQVHLDLDNRLSFQAAHDISENVEQRIQALFPLADIIVHIDPRVV